MKVRCFSDRSSGALCRCVPPLDGSSAQGIKHAASLCLPAGFCCQENQYHGSNDECAAICTRVHAQRALRAVTGRQLPLRPRAVPGSPLASASPLPLPPPPSSAASSSCCQGGSSAEWWEIVIIDGCLSVAGVMTTRISPALVRNAYIYSHSSRKLSNRGMPVEQSCERLWDEISKHGVAGPSDFLGPHCSSSPARPERCHGNPVELGHSAPNLQSADSRRNPGHPPVPRSRVSLSYGGMSNLHSGWTTVRPSHVCSG